MTQAVRLSATENEVLPLMAATGSIDDLLSRDLFTVTGTDPDSGVLFHDHIAQRLFNILLVDTLGPMDRDLVGAPHSIVEALRGICAVPQFGDAATIVGLHTSVEALTAWLETQIKVSIHLPSIGRSEIVGLHRREFVEACGNISKHNFARLTRTAAKIRKVFARGGVTIGEEESLLVLDDFHDRFHTDILNYHSTALVELFNNVRWGIHEYLTPEYHRALALEPGDPPRYSYRYPSSVTSGMAKAWYWELMNAVRRGPPLRRFVGTQWLKLRY